METKRDTEALRRTPYIETFDDGPGGWIGWDETGAVRPEIEGGRLISRGPWWVDSNHAPPGAGYLHLLACLHTHSAYVPTVARPNRFVEGGYSRDLTNARLTARIRGDIDLRGAQLVLLAQADVPGTRTNFVLTGQPLAVATEWVESTIKLRPNAAEWACLGSHRDRAHVYGYGDIRDVLRDVNCDIILVLFPVDVRAVEAIDDIHALRPYRDYTPDSNYLPRGVVECDTIRIDYAE